MRCAGILLVAMLISIGLSGCVTYGKHGATKYDFERDQSACLHQRSLDYPVNMKSVHVRTDTSCATNVWGVVNCTSTPIYETINTNPEPPWGYVKKCLLGKGYQVKKDDDQNRKSKNKRKIQIGM